MMEESPCRRCDHRDEDKTQFPACLNCHKINEYQMGRRPNTPKKIWNFKRCTNPACRWFGMDQQPENFSPGLDICKDCEERRRTKPEGRTIAAFETRICKDPGCPAKGAPQYASAFRGSWTICKVCHSRRSRIGGQMRVEQMREANGRKGAIATNEKRKLKEVMETMAEKAKVQQDDKGGREIEMIDFGLAKGMREKLEGLAEREFRTFELQVLYLLHRSLDMEDMAK